MTCRVRRTSFRFGCGQYWLAPSALFGRLSAQPAEYERELPTISFASPYASSVILKLMAQWAKAQRLTGGQGRLLRDLYNSYFPLEARHHFAEWLEAQSW